MISLVINATAYVGGKFYTATINGESTDVTDRRKTHAGDVIVDDTGYVTNARDRNLTKHVKTLLVWISLLVQGRYVKALENLQLV